MNVFLPTIAAVESSSVEEVVTKKDDKKKEKKVEQVDESSGECKFSLSIITDKLQTTNNRK